MYIDTAEQKAKELLNKNPLAMGLNAADNGDGAAVPNKTLFTYQAGGTKYNVAVVTDKSQAWFVVSHTETAWYWTNFSFQGILPIYRARYRSW